MTAPIRLIAPLCSLVLLLASIGANFVPTLISVPDESIGALFAALTAANCVFFLLGAAIAVLISTDQVGRLRAPQSLGALLCWFLVLPQAGIAIGALIHHQDALEITEAAGELEGDIFRVQGPHLAVLNGEIGSATFPSLRRAMVRADIVALELRSPGGLIDAAVEIGHYIRQHDLDTLVTDNCESACVIIALSGRSLTVAHDAQFGFHRGSVLARTNSELGRFISDTATNDFMAHLERLGIPQQVLRIAENTPAWEIYYVTGEKLIEWKLAQPFEE